MDQRATQAELLLHAAGEFAGRALGKAGEVGGAEQLGQALLKVGFAETEQGGKKLDVFADRQFRVEVLPQPLRHIGDARVQAGAVAARADAAAEHVQLALLEDFHPGDQAQQTGFARAIRADQGAAGAGFDAEFNAFQRRLFPVAMAQTAGLNRELAHCRLAGQSIAWVRT